MNKIEENIFESMSDTIDTLKNELSIVIDDYEDLRIAVIDFFVNVRNGDMAFVVVDLDNKESKAKECSNKHARLLLSHVSWVKLKILQQYIN